MSAEEFDPETGEMMQTVEPDSEDDRGRAGRDGNGEPLSLDDIADATVERLKGAPLTDDEIRARLADSKRIPVGIMGWLPKIGGLPKKDGMTTPGAKVEGQIVATRPVRGKFGIQQIVVIQGRASWPTYKNSGGQVVKGIKDRPGRWIVGIDASLQELPQFVGEVVSIEIEKRGGAGQRHTYACVNLCSAGVKA